MASQDPAVHDAIRALHARFDQLYNEGRLDELVELFYTEDARALPPNAPTVRGRGPIAALNRATRESGDVQARLSSVHVEHHGDMAYHIGRYEVTVRRPGGEPIHDVGKTLEVYRRQPDGSWKCVADMWNSDQPATP
jgi:ketosteroid isomerase-like protein